MERNSRSAKVQATPLQDSGRTLKVFDLEQPRTESMPIPSPHRPPGFSYLLHRHHEDLYRPEETGSRTSAAGVITCAEHSGTHIDAICHQADDLCLLGGIPVGEVQTSKGFSRHGVEEIPPIVTQGVMLDVASTKRVEGLEPGYAISAEDLMACSELQNTPVEADSVVLVRTGNALYWDEPDKYLAGPGVAGSGSEWLAEQQVAAVGADNVAWDVIGLRDPKLGHELYGHLVLLARKGIYIVENLNLEELAAAGCYQFLFVCTPLKIEGATGSPVRPLAITYAE